jgi:hypothetical protein
VVPLRPEETSDLPPRGVARFREEAQTPAVERKVMSRCDQLRVQERELTRELQRVKRLRRQKLDDDDLASGQIVTNLAVEITRLTKHLEACQRELAEADCPPVPS